MGESVGAGDLAALLRELKEGSGLSYGALAKRLHMSTSTLHRYVNGSAVPTEFAPLERFARVCGASRERMVELHRQWILADASRGDRKEGEAPRGAGPDAPPAPASGGPVAEETATPDSDAASAMPDSETTSAAPDSGAASAPDGEAPGRAPAAAAPDFVIGPAPGAAGSRPGSRRLPRARVLVAAGAVLALGATAVAVQAASGSGGDRHRVSANSPSPHGGERERHPDATGSPSPSAKESGKGKPGKKTPESGRPGDGGKGADGQTGAPGAGSGGKDGGAEGGTGAAPVTVSTQPQHWTDPCGHPYLVDKEPGSLSPPPNEQDAAGWVTANGAVSAREQTVKLTVQGTGGETVVLESLNVRVAGTSAPLAWNNYKMGYLGVGCGGNVPKHSFDVDLDASVPRPAPQGGDGFPYTVSASDPEAFYVNATANARYVRWYLELEWSSGGRRGTVRIDDTGKPFATSGDQGRPVYGFSLNSKKWTKTNRDNDDVPDPPA